MSHITTSTNTMSETLSQELSLLMWYLSRFVFLVFFMVTQSWKMLLLTWMLLPICWVIAKFTGNFQEVELLHPGSIRSGYVSMTTNEAKATKTGAFALFQSIARRQQDSLAEANQVATETFSHIKTVKSFANEDGETEKYRVRLDKTFRINQIESLAYAVNMWASTVSVQRF